MAVARTPPQVANPYEFFGDQAEFGPALFSRLVPFSVHVATTIYEGRRDQLVNRSIIPGLETLNEQMHSLLSSLDLPGSLQALEKPMGIPPSLQQHAEELRQADAVARVHKSFADIEKLRAADMAIFEEGKSMLLSEEEEDQRLRAKYGTDRWSRPESRSDPEGSSLWGLVSQFETWFTQSVTSDGNVRKKFAAIEDVLEVLCGPTRGLTEYIPSSSSREMADELKPVVGRLRSAYSDVLRLESRRRKKVEALRETARRDDIKPDILKEAARLERTYPNTALDAAHFEEFFDKRLDRLYEPEQEALDKEAEDQERLLSEVERVNKEFESQKQRLGNRGNRAREQALQKLDDAYFKYKETVNNLEEGRSFYNQLNQHVGQQFRDVVKGWVARRRMEARTLSE
jgi:programmed cell death 6-interacting protein